MKSYPIRTNKHVGITAITNASPMVVTTAGDHGITTGDTVEIAQVVGPTNANGEHITTVVSATTFSLDDSAGNADYVGGGGFVSADPALRTYPAVTSLTGDPVDTSGANETDKFRFSVQADQNPVTATKELTCKVYGRLAPDSDWFLIDTIDNTDTWSTGIDDATLYLAQSTSLSVYPYLRIDVVAFASSTTNFKAWMTL